MTSSAGIRVEVLVFEGCPHAEPAMALARRVVDRLVPDSRVKRVEVDTADKAAALGFLGSPSIRVDGVDVEGKTTTHGALCCRTYPGGGVPPEWMVEAAVLRTLEPRGILFLCVANSARSQMAEGIALSMAPAGTKVWSAGSRPTSVRLEAITVLKEIGIDISRHSSKAVSEIPVDEVDTVITLCGEEECPLFLGKAWRLHWGLPDPAAVNSAENERLDAFRETRDELRRRIEKVFVGERNKEASGQTRNSLARMAGAVGRFLGLWVGVSGVMASGFTCSCGRPECAVTPVMAVILGGIVTLFVTKGPGGPKHRRSAMSKIKEEKPKGKGFFATLKESMTKTSEGCGPGCGCHVEVKKDDKAETDETSQKKDTSK